jgi:hypothetical protein
MVRSTSFLRWLKGVLKIVRPSYSSRRQLDEERERFGQHLLTKHFVGAAFEDRLFNTDNQEREKACAWKIMRTLPLGGPLADDSWLWSAVGIPLSLADKSLKGDVDLMFNVRGEPERRGGELVRVNGDLVFHPFYRCFELKTSKVTGSGAVRSLKEGKIHKTIAQLEKLCRMGAPQVFLLDVFIIEAGFSPSCTIGMPQAVIESISKKSRRMTGVDFGYVTQAVEQIPDYSEDIALRWPILKIKDAKRASPEPSKG